MIAGIGRTLDVALQTATGSAPRRRSADRRLLEEQILPTFALDRSIVRVLFCGCARYTQAYEESVPALGVLDARSVTATPALRLEVAHRRPTGSAGPARCRPVRSDHLQRRARLGYRAISNRQKPRFAPATPRSPQVGAFCSAGTMCFPRNRVSPEDIAALAAFKPTQFASFGARVRAPGWHRHVFDFYRKRE